MTTGNAVAHTRAPQVAIVPLNEVQIEDVGRDVSAIDAWLQDISGGAVTLERLQHVAGLVPVVGNVMALADAIGDIVSLIKNGGSDPLDWVSLGINLVCVAPFPGTTAARVSLRSILSLARSELAHTGKIVLGDALIEVMVGHLNATIVGRLEHFLTIAQSQLPDLLEQAGGVGEELVLDLAKGMRALVDGDMDVKGRLASAQQHITSINTEQLKRNPFHIFTNVYGALRDVQVAAGTSVANSAAKLLMPVQAKKRVYEQTEHLIAMAPELRVQLRKLNDPALKGSIGSLLVVLNKAVQLWRSRNPHALSSSIKTGTTSKARYTQGKGELEVRKKEVPAQKTANPVKNGPCVGSCNSILFSLGAETFSHTDFSLPGPFPIDWTRTYYSRLSAYDQGALGARWITEFTTRFDLHDKGLVFHDSDGREHKYALKPVGQAHYDAIENLTLVRVTENTLLLCRGFERKESYVRHGDCFLLAQIELRNGAGVMLHHEYRHADQPVLSDLITYQGDLDNVHLHLGTMMDEHGRLTGLWEIRDSVPVRQLAAYYYDAHGDLINAQDENGAAWTYQYQHHLITRYTDRTNRGMNLQWQGTGPDAKAVREWADDGSFDTRLEWDENIRLTYVTDAHGHETWHYYDILGYTYRIRHADGRSEWLFRDDAKNIVRHVHPDGSTDRYAYDDRSNLLEHTRADHSVMHYAYDDHDQLIKISDAEGGLWLRDYDDQGNLIEAVDPLGNTTEYAYNDSGLPTAIKDANGNEKTLAYNDAGQLIEYTDCSGKTSVWEYNDLGQMVCFTDAAGNTTEYIYKAGQLIHIKHPDNTEERFSRDAEGRLLAHTDGLNRCTTWRYTAAGLIDERIDAAEQTLRYRWDRLGQLLALENENRQQATFHYDPVGRLLKETGFDGRSTLYAYDESTGRLASTVDGQRTTQVEFDPTGRLIERTARLGGTTQTETFAYDGNGNLLMASNADSRLQWFHDPAGNLLREHQHYLSLQTPVVAVWQHEYDVLNQRIATTRPDGHRVSWLTYGSGHLLGLRLDEHELIGYERDDLHREVARHQGNHLLQTQQWDPAGRLQEQLLGRREDQTTLLKRTYQYDAASQLTDIHDSRRGPLSYRYDPVGRLLNATSRLGVETFAFDPASNLLDEKNQQVQRPLDHDPKRNTLMDNLLREYAGSHYDHDERGNQIRRWHNGQHSRLHWDLFDRLVRFENSQLSVDYAYDPLGRRLYKHSNAHHLNRSEAGSQWNRNEQARKQRELGCGFTLFGWDGDTLAWESSPAQADGASGKTVHYLYEPGTFVPVAQALRHQPMRLLAQPSYTGAYDIDQDPLWTHTPQALPIDVLAWYQCDHLGTPQELTDPTGQIAWSAQYKAWGEVIEQRSDWARQKGLTNPIRFQGQYHDHETGLHYNRYRYYDPRVGRFISKDPISYAGGLNLYAYAPNPTGWVDPLGLSKRTLPSATPVHRIGGNSIDNLRLKDAEKNLNPPGISVLHSCCSCDASKQMREAFPKASGLQRAAETVASGYTDNIRAAGFDVIEDPTNKFPNHARIIHPNGEAGFNDSNLGKLSDALGSTTKCP